MKKTFLTFFLLTIGVVQAEESVNKINKDSVRVKEKAHEETRVKKNLKEKNYVTRHDLSFVLSGSAVGRNIINKDYIGYGIDGFSTQVGSIPLHRDSGFNLNYAELGGYFDLGQYFDSRLLLHIHPDDMELDEAFFRTKKLPAHLELKAGVFMSDFGRINSLHPDEQKFVALPLVYEAMLGLTENLNDAGLAMQWRAPTEHSLMVGAEVLHARNSLSFSQEKRPIYVGYIKSGLNINEQSSVLLGGSVAEGKTEDKEKSRLYGAELSFKYKLDTNRYLSLDSEYLSRDRAGVKQAGFYTQLFYDIDAKLGVGARYDAITKNRIGVDDDLNRYNAILAFRQSKSGLFRLQYSLDKSKRFAGQRKENQELVLEFIMTVGNHDTHDHR